MAVQTRIKEHWGEVARFLKEEYPHFSAADLQWIDGDYDRLFTTIGRYYHQVNIIEEEKICGRIQKFLIEIGDV